MANDYVKILYMYYKIKTCDNVNKVNFAKQVYPGIVLKFSSVLYNKLLIPWFYASACQTDSVEVYGV